MTIDDMTNPSALERITEPSNGRPFPTDAVTNGPIALPPMSEHVSATFNALAAMLGMDATATDITPANITPPDIITPSLVRLGERMDELEAALKHAARLSQWFTPPWLAAEIVSTIDVRDRVLLEPSAGDGAIVEALLAAGARWVVAVEIDPAMAAKLSARFVGRNVAVVCADFLTVELDTDIDAIAGNIPYDKGADTKHLTRLAEIIVSRDIEASLLLRTVAVHSAKRWERVWSRLAVREMRPCVDRIPFPPAGGEPLEAGKIDVSIFRIGARRPGELMPISWLREPGRAA